MKTLCSASLSILMVGGIINGGCQSVYFKTLEQLGIHKRDILVDRVTEARDAQEDAAVQFESALEQFKSVVQFDGGDLEEKYETLNTALEQSEERAKAVRDRIAAVQKVAEALFAEWEDELEQYHDPQLERASQRTLDATRRMYDKMMRAMESAESKIDPVLNPLRDQVLFLKHNLNAQAIASIEQELVMVENNVDELLQEMRNAIREAESFIKEIKKE